MPEKRTISRLHFIDEYEMPYNYQFDNTSVGGLSGIDYNPATKEYYLVCDDRSAINPARFYTAAISFDDKKIDTVIFTARNNLLQADGQTYPSLKTDAKHAPDPESIRYNATNDCLVWSSEGDRILTGHDTVLQNPAIMMVNRSGKYLDTFPLPMAFRMTAMEKGPRKNGAFEGICFADNNQSMYIATEAPLYEDGPAAGLTDSSALVRILKYNVPTKKLLSQYAYKLEPIAHASTPADGFKVNGIVDMLAINNNEFLITERSYSAGVKNCTIKVYQCSFQKARDVKAIPSLQAAAPKKLLAKKLLLNMDDLGIYIDNVEGATFGPDLPNGHRSIIFVSDNDFLPNRKTQFLLFEVIE